MRFENEEADAEFGEECVDAGNKSALGEPDTARRAAKVLFIVIDGDRDLGATGLVGDHERQETVGCAAGDDFEGAFVLELFKDGQNLAMPFFVEEALGFGEFVSGRICGVVERRTGFGDFLFFGEFAEFVEMCGVTLLEKRIGEHFAEGRREAHGEPEADAVVGEPAHHTEERNVGFGHGLIEPVFFEEVRVFGVTNEREMRMQDDAEIAL